MPTGASARAGAGVAAAASPRPGAWDGGTDTAALPLAWFVGMFLTAEGSKGGRNGGGRHERENERTVAALYQPLSVSRPYMFPCVTSR